MLHFLTACVARSAGRRVHLVVLVAMAHCRIRGHTGRRCPPTVSLLTRPAVFRRHYLCFRSCCCGRQSTVAVRSEAQTARTSLFVRPGCPRLTVHSVPGCSTCPIASPSVSPVPLCPLPRWVEATRLCAGVLLAQYCSGSCLPAGLAAACPGPVALASASCPCQRGLAAGAPLRLSRLALGAARAAPGAVAAAVGCPRDRSALRRGRPSAVPGLAAAQRKMRTGRALAGEPLGPAGAIAGMVVLFPCSRRAARGRCASRLPCRRLSRHREAVAAGCCIVMWCS
jgi:hypothetical protein